MITNVAVVETRYWLEHAMVLDVYETSTNPDAEYTVQYASCGGGPAANAFHVSWAVTPIIMRASLGGYAASAIWFAGYLPGAEPMSYWIRIGSSNNQADGGGAGGHICHVDELEQVGAYGQSPAPLGNLGSGWESIIFARLPSVNGSAPGGSYGHLFLEARDTYNKYNKGQSGQPVWGRHTKRSFGSMTNFGGDPTLSAIGQADPFSFTVFPSISSTTSASVGLGGMTVYTLYGDGFSTNSSLISVTLAGVPCTVLTSSASHVECTPSAAPASTIDAVQPGVLYAGGAGLLHAVYLGGRRMEDMGAISAARAYSGPLSAPCVASGCGPAIDLQGDWSSPRDAADFVKWVQDWPGSPTSTVQDRYKPTFVTVNADSLQSYFGYPTLDQAWHVEVLTGFFVAPVSAFYTFYAVGDDFVSVHLSTDASPANQTLVAYGDRSYGPPDEKGWDQNHDANNFYHLFPMASQSCCSWNTNYARIDGRPRDPRRLALEYFWTNGANPKSVANTRISAPIWCKAGVPRYVRVQHHSGYYHNDQGGTSQSTPDIDFFTVGIRMHTQGGANTDAMKFTSDTQRAVSVTPQVLRLIFGASSSTAAMNSDTVPWPGTFDDAHNVDGKFVLCVDVHNGHGERCTKPIDLFHAMDFSNTCFTPTFQDAYHNHQVGGCNIGAWGDLCDYCLGTNLQSALIDATSTDAIAASGQPTSPFHPLATWPHGQLDRDFMSFKCTSTKYCIELILKGPMAGATFRVQLSGNSSYYTTPDTNNLNSFGQPVEVFVTEPFSLVDGAGLPAAFRQVVVQDSGGDPFYFPAPMHWFRTALPLPAVSVTSAGLQAVCNHVQSTVPVPRINPNNTARLYYTPGVAGQFDAIRFDESTTAEMLHGCSFHYNASLTPYVTSVVSSNGSIVMPGAVLTIEGYGFLPLSAGTGLGVSGRDLTLQDLDVVTLQGTDGAGSGLVFGCPTLTASATRITCRVGDAAAGEYDIQVEIMQTRGIALYAAGARRLTVGNSHHFGLSATVLAGSLYPLVGSRMGGTAVTFSGSGFSPHLAENAVLVGGAPCAVFAASVVSLSCYLPRTVDATPTGTAIANKMDVAAAVTVSVHRGPTLAVGTYTYAYALTPLVTVMTPTSLGSAVSALVNFTVVNIPSSRVPGGALNITVTFGAGAASRPCSIYSETLAYVAASTSYTASIVCVLRRNDTMPLPQAPLVPYLPIADLGFAALDGGAAPLGGYLLDAGFRVDSVSPIVGSIAGGTRLTISGAGFSATADRTSVTFHNPASFSDTPDSLIDCIVIFISKDGRVLECVTGRPNTETGAFWDFTHELNGTDPRNPGLHAIPGTFVVTVNGYDSNCGVACTFNYSSAATPTLTNVTFDTAAETATLTGTQLQADVAVWFGLTQAAPPDAGAYAADGTSVTVRIPYIEASESGVSIFVHVSGALGNVPNAWNFLYTQGLQLFSLAPVFGGNGVVGCSQSAGSTNGGHELIVLGRGFSLTTTRNLVVFSKHNMFNVSATGATIDSVMSSAGSGSKRATVVSATLDHIIFATPQFMAPDTLYYVSVYLLDATGSPHASVVLASGAQSDPGFVYFSSASFQPWITSVSAQGSAITITGSGFGRAPSDADPCVGATAGSAYVFTGNGSAVVVGNAPCAVTAWGPSSITCTASSGTAGGDQNVVVSVATAGVAASVVTFGGGSLALTSMEHDVNQSSRRVGAGGGAVVTLHGRGFATDARYSTNVVTINGVVMPVVWSTATSISFIYTGTFVSSLVFFKYNTYEPKRIAPSSVWNYVFPPLFDGGNPRSWPTTWPGGSWDGDVATKFQMGHAAFVLGDGLASTITRLRWFPTPGSCFAMDGSSFYATTVRSAYDAFVNYADPSADLNWVAQNISGTAISAGWELIYQVPNNETGEGWNFHDLPAPLTKPYVAFAHVVLPHFSGTGAQELEFQGVTFDPVTAFSSPRVIVTTTTPGSDWTGAKAQSAWCCAGELVIAPELTPAVFSISPAFGTALGGDTVTIRGDNFGTGVDTVALNGVPCTVLSSNNTAVTCVTTARQEILPTSLAVNCTGRGLAVVYISTVFWRFLDRWSHLTTWLNNEPPGDGDSVVVPEGQSILVDVSTPVLFLVLVQGTMIFDKAQPSLTFDASYVVILGGYFEAGTKADPYLNNLTITIHGNRLFSVEIPTAGAKCLAAMNAMSDMGAGQMTMTPEQADQYLLAMLEPGYASMRRKTTAMRNAMGSEFGLELATIVVYPTPMDPTPPGPDYLGSLMSSSAAPAAGEATPKTNIGVIEIHGKPRQRVWTFGAGPPALAGTSRIRTLEPVDYVAGETLVVTTTGYDRYETERVVVAGRPDAHTIDLVDPLQFDHDCMIYTEGRLFGHADIRICYEVALLSRNLVIQGDEFSVDGLFGVHLIAAMGAQFRLQDAELRACGQAFVVGRYCAHYHLLFDSSTNYAISNSFHDGFQRAVTVHACEHLQVRDNVAFLIMAHSFFVEDGVERYNTFSGNLAISQLSSHGPLKSDFEGSCFWSASPENLWEHNVCAGGDAHGFWFQLEPNPTGPSSSAAVVPSAKPLWKVSSPTSKMQARATREPHALVTRTASALSF